MIARMAIKSAITLVVFYFIFAFVTWEPSAAEWGSEGRAGLVLMWVWASIVIAIVIAIGEAS